MYLFYLVNVAIVLDITSAINDAVKEQVTFVLFDPHRWSQVPPREWVSGLNGCFSATKMKWKDWCWSGLVTTQRLLDLKNEVNIEASKTAVALRSTLKYARLRLNQLKWLPLNILHWITNTFVAALMAQPEVEKQSPSFPVFMENIFNVFLGLFRLHTDTNALS